MSQTENSNVPFRWFESIHIQPTAPSSESTVESAQSLPDQDWETVTFPHSLSVEAIPPAANPAPTRSVVLPLTASAQPSKSPEPAVTLSDSPVTPPIGETFVIALPIVTPPAMVLEPSIEPSPEVDAMSTCLSTTPEPPLATEDYLRLAAENEQLRHQMDELERALDRAQTVLATSTDQWQSKLLAQAAEFTHRLNQQAEQHRQAIDAMQAQMAHQTQVMQGLTEQERGSAQTLEATQDRITGMFQELEQAHQTTQRQQILLETLTTQLTTGQERIGQLERECAIAQQRYTDQLQATLQAESACKDLRSRLNRQQRHTLQFKAALEKCLEVPAAQGFAYSALTQQAEADLASPPEASKTVAPFIPKAQPVQPWTAQPGFLALEYRSIEPSPRDDAPPANQPESTAVAELTEAPARPVSIAPKITTGRTIAAIELPRMLTLVPEPTVSVSAPEADLTAVSDAPESPTASPTPSATEGATEGPFEPMENLANTDLWAMEPESTSEPEPLPSQAVSELTHVTSAEAAVDCVEGEGEESGTPWSSIAAPASISDVPYVTTPDAPKDPLGVVTEEVEMAEPDSDSPRVIPLKRVQSNAVSADDVTDGIRPFSPFITLATDLSDRPKSEENSPLVAAAEASPAMLFYANGPSPIVYPLRPTKKLASLAAVQLPSFPQSGK